MIVYLDSSALIYLIEGNEPHSGKVRKALGAIARKYPGPMAAVSRLAWLECRIGPLKTNDRVALAAYDEFFARPDLIVIELDRNVVELATAVRARYGLRTPDALHAASCLQLDAEHVFLTGDRSFRRVHGLSVRVVA